MDLRLTAHQTDHGFSLFLLLHYIVIIEIISRKGDHLIVIDVFKREDNYYIHYYTGDLTGWKKYLYWKCNALKLMLLLQLLLSSLHVIRTNGYV